jgi:hypothetical protein
VSRRRAAGPLGIVLEREAIVLQLPEGALGDAVVAFDLTWEATDKALALKQAA